MRTYKVVLVNEYGKRTVTLKAKNREEVLACLAENGGGLIVSVNGRKPEPRWWR